MATDDDSKIAKPGPRSGEPPFQLKCEPEDYLTIKWEPEICTAEIKIENITSSRQTFKVRGTSNGMFRIKPPIGMLNAGQSATVRITCKSTKMPENHRHYFAIYHFQVDDARLGPEEKPRTLWKTDYTVDGVTRIVALFETGAKKEEPEENKEENDDDKNDHEKQD
ncbi:unnamed protein product, partial [Mesorhabditis spiculigera]